MTERNSRQGLLIISVIVNIFLLGAIVGAAAIWFRKPTPTIAGGRMRLAGEQLPEPARTALQKALQETRRASREVAREGRSARDEAARLLSEQTLNQPALSAALARARQADMTMRTRLEDRTVEFATTITRADRLRMAEGLRRRVAPRAAR